MARACGYELSDGTRCQVQTEAAHCELHWARLRGSDVSSPVSIREFLKANQGEVIDLKGFRFRAMHFESTLFPVGKHIIFDDSSFYKCRFVDVAFEGNVSFANCTFEGTTFENVCSNDSSEGCTKVDFTYATFLGQEVPFHDCMFDARDEILFAETTFEGRDTPFWMCHLRSKLVSFFRASINANRFYLRVCTPGLAVVDHHYLMIDSRNINLANLLANGHFEYGNSEDATGVAPLVSFLRTDFRQMRTATFRDANLTYALFIESVIESVHFINPEWQVGDRRTPVLYDKLSVNTDERATDNQLLRLYVQLKRNYEEQRDYSMAGKWFYREMECRRRLVDAKPDSGAFVRWVTRSLFRAYKAVSDYGENLVKPLVLLFCLFLLWGPLYFYWGFGVGQETVSYDCAGQVSAESVKDFFNAMFYSFGIMSFQLTKTAFQHGIVSSLLAVIQILFTLILVPLFLLALRRKFRR